LANIKSAEKRIRADKRKAERNRSIKSGLHTSIKKARNSIEGSGVEKATEDVAKAIRAIDKAQSKGIIHRNNAARRKSRLMKKLADTDKKE
tara:strand:+ start:696 stop:968 length:273 start_codon:yes stop_codon:yes gene_type:complete